MPPKGKQRELKKKKFEDKQEIVRSSLKQTLLQTKLDEKIRELTEIKLRVHAAQEENNWLNEEAQRLEIEMNEYKQFMFKKKNLRRMNVVTLSDYHRQEIQDINQDKETILQRYKEKKQELQMQIMRKQQLLLQFQEELESMEGYKIIREQQNNEIKRLQNEVERMRNEHVHEISRIKLNIEKELQEQRSYENAQFEKIRQQEKKELRQFLYEQSLTIQNENVKLRETLQDILKRTQLLNDLKQRLEEEQLHLINRIKLMTDLRRIRLDKVSSDIIDD